MGKIKKGGRTMQKERVNSKQSNFGKFDAFARELRQKIAAVNQEREDLLGYDPKLMGSRTRVMRGELNFRALR